MLILKKAPKLIRIRMVKGVELDIINLTPYIPMYYKIKYCLFPEESSINCSHKHMLMGFELFHRLYKTLIFKYLTLKSNSNLVLNSSMIILPSSQKKS